MSKSGVVHVNLNKLTGKQFSFDQDLVAVEEPLEIRVGYGPSAEREQRTLSITMRTPGQDFELAIGFLFSEGLIESYDQIKDIHYCENVKKEEKENVIRVELNEKLNIDFSKLERYFYTNSSCGVCGKTSIEALENLNCKPQGLSFSFKKELVKELPGIMLDKQLVFEYTGGIHAAALFNIKGELSALKEDVGRHNALDKLIGWALINKLVPLSESILMVSGRVSYELMQKAIIAEIPVVIAVGAPSSLAVDMAAKFNITLIGFTRNNKFNVYHGIERLV